MVTSGLAPALVWKYFEAISLIPRGSKNEKAVGDFVMKTAASLDLEAWRDDAGNIVVRKPASAGMEGRPRVCLQGHLDMVCEKTPDTVHNFLKDPIKLRIVGEHLMAEGTTLGADNGIAVATNLAIMEDESLVHGPLEFLFTVDEETGLTGANELQPGFVESKILLNLDSEEEGELCVGCAGACDNLGHWHFKLDAAPKGLVTWTITVSGLKGGHSGMEIDKQRGNAIRILGRLLTVAQSFGARVAAMDGGSKRNAIARDAHAVLAVPAAKATDARVAIERCVADITAEFDSLEPNVAVALVQPKGKRVSRVFPRAVQKKILAAIAALPHGVIKMSPDIAGLVETSSNLAVLTTHKKGVTIATSQRSSVASELKDAANTVAAVFELAGASLEAPSGYPGWKPNLASPILKLAQQTYTKMTGKTPAVRAVHAGLECGIIGEKYPGMDMVSFGPTMTGVHSPDEKLEIASVPRFYDYLLAILKNV